MEAKQGVGDGQLAAAQGEVSVLSSLPSLILLGGRAGPRVGTACAFMAGGRCQCGTAGVRRREPVNCLWAFTDAPSYGVAAGVWQGVGERHAAGTPQERGGRGGEGRRVVPVVTYCCLGDGGCPPSSCASGATRWYAVCPHSAAALVGWPVVHLSAMDKLDSRRAGGYPLLDITMALRT